jgi:NCAIR mutase (PurE)-related protein
VDTHRACGGFPEVIFGAGKTPAVESLHPLVDHDNAVAARVTPNTRGFEEKIQTCHPHELARCVTIQTKPLPKRPAGAVVCAGTSDLPVAEEAAVTADIMGNRVERIHDAGVAGLHRLLGRLDTIRLCRMEDG